MRAMASEHERPRITEVQVRIDCNGCVQKIKKALHRIPGISDLYIDFPQQKITIIGCADPAKIIKAIKKTRKGAIICFNTEPTDPPAQPEEASFDGGNQSTTEAQQTETQPPEEPPKEPASPPPSVHNPPQETEQPAEENHSSPTPNTTGSQPVEPSIPKDVEEVHVIHHYPPDYSYRYNYGQTGRTSTQPRGPTFMAEPPELHIPARKIQGTHNYNTHRQELPVPLYATHNYNTHMPSPYVTQYENTRPSPQYTNYSRPVPYSQDYNYYYGNNNNGNITSVFSDENPNACTIV